MASGLPFVRRSFSEGGFIGLEALGYARLGGSELPKEGLEACRILAAWDS